MPPSPSAKMSEGHILLWHPTCTLSTSLLQCHALHLSFWLRTLKLDWCIWRDPLFQTIWQLLWQLDSLFRSLWSWDQSKQKLVVVGKTRLLRNNKSNWIALTTKISDYWRRDRPIRGTLWQSWPQCSQKLLLLESISFRITTHLLHRPVGSPSDNASRRARCWSARPPLSPAKRYRCKKSSFCFALHVDIYIIWQ